MQAKCGWCKSDFESRPARGGMSRFCSKECGYKGRKHEERLARRKATHCKRCGEEIPLTLCGHALYCSRSCFRATQKESKPAKPLRVANCVQCGAEFSTKNDEQRFCNKKCTNAYHNANRTLPANTIYDCLICGKHVEKYVIPHAVKIGSAKNLYCSRKCKGNALTAENHPRWNGGRHLVGGYWFVYDPEATGSRQYTLEHRLVMERHIGRKLKRHEVVHHKNEDTTDNRIENLQLCENQSEHKKLHEPNRDRNELGQYMPVQRVGSN